MSLNEQARADWLHNLTLTLPKEIKFDVGPRDREFGIGDLVGTVTTVIGPGHIRDALWDVHAYQVRIFCRERDLQVVKDTMFGIDDAIVNLDTPGLYWGVWVTSSSRASSGPVPLQADEHQRVSWACTYLAEVAV